MKHLIAFLLFLVSLPALAAGPIASLVASRTSGTAPLCVHFDATDSTDADTTNPFRDLLYRWNFGDPGAGNWAQGANTSLPKNLGRGPVAAHCYETAGSYTAKLQVCDSTACVSTSQAITVTAADTTFSTTNTTCFFNSAVGSGCPAGATETASSDFDAAITACVASGKRCLFKRGDTFPASAISTLSTTITGAQIGAYGSGAKPIITVSGINIFNLTGTLSDIVISDLEFVGAGVASSTGTLASFQANTTNMTFLRVTCRDHGACYSMSGVGTTNIATGLFIVDSSMSAYTGGNGSYLAIRQSALMGNFVDDARGTGYADCPTCSAEHGLRVQYGQKSVISNNYLGKALANKHQLTIRAAPRGSTGAVENNDVDTNRIVVADNYFDSTHSGVIQMTVAPSSTQQCHWIRDVIVERNHFNTALANSYAMTVEGKRMTVRNNLQIASAVSTGATFISITSSNDSGGLCTEDPVVNAANKLPQREDFVVENNTIYNAAAVADYNVVTITGNRYSIINNAVHNNLVYGPAITQANYTLPYTTGTVTWAAGPANNSTATQAKNTNPFAVTPTTVITSRPTTAAYATNGGTARFPSTAEDFYFCRDRTGVVRIGALVPAARAQCSGTAGAP